MKLNGTEREKLRTGMLDVFTSSDLEIFVSDELNRDLKTIIPTTDTFEVMCQQFILWAERQNELTRFLQAAVADGRFVRLHPLARELIAKAGAAAAAGGAAPKPFIVSGRPVVDRDPLWQRVTALGGRGASRVLVVNGGVGKSHSVWMLSYLCDPSFGTARLVWIDARDADLPITPGSFAKLLASRLWDAATPAGGDPFAQDARDSKALGTLMINGLSRLATDTWLVVDELDLVNLEPESLDLLARLSKAIDAGQCPNVWLFLIGLEPKRLGAQVGQFVPVDLVTRPKKTDIESYMTWFAGSVESNEDPNRIAASVDELDAILQPAPSYADWDAFTEKLQEKCTKLASGDPL
jgi:hypothetical protein